MALLAVTGRSDGARIDDVAVASSAEVRDAVTLGKSDASDDATSGDDVATGVGE